MKYVTFNLYPEAQIENYKNEIDSYNTFLRQKSFGSSISELQKIEALEKHMETGIDIQGRSFNEVISKTIRVLGDSKSEFKSLDLYWGSDETGLSRLDIEEAYVHFIGSEGIKKFNDLFEDDCLTSSLKSALKEYRSKSPDAEYLDLKGNVVSEEAIFNYYLENLVSLQNLFKKAKNNRKVIVVCSLSS